MEFLHKWWMHLTGGASFGAIVLFVFRDWLLDIGKAFITWFVKKWESMAQHFWDRRKNTRKQEDKVLIGALQQQVKDLASVFKKVEKRLAKTELRLENCQQERTECRADLSNLTARVMSLEKKMR